MWPFRQKPSRADAVIAVMDKAIDFAADRWSYYNNQLKFRPEVPLGDIITSFLVPFEQELQNNFPSFKEAPSGIGLLIAAKGIERSGSHSAQQIEAALGVSLPQ